MLEYLSATKRHSVVFNGLVAASSVITGSALWNTFAFPNGNTGNAITANDNEPWLDFTLDGKHLLVAKKAYRDSVMWKTIYEAGAVYASNNNGPTGLSLTGLTATVQNKTITIGGKQYRVRLLKGANSDPAHAYTGNATVADTSVSEWDRLMFSIAASRPSKSVYGGPIYANYTDLDLGIVDNTAGEGTGGYSWCQEHHPDGDAYRVCRGFYYIGTIYRESLSLVSAGWGWRPVLEEIKS